ncbi:hypothetical protein BpHYR1_045290 [Brachionus plicatilis]|uniref:Uncharacterized protein n=1 Tax=Brachionus plicatilis TaxID=10195 RepID=A0A3M7SMZ6_BRAPC|nr:hypothetical protein BpHYR1_045290 [Brachionus plicatilis]
MNFGYNKYQNDKLEMTLYQSAAKMISRVFIKYLESGYLFHLNRIFRTASFGNCPTGAFSKMKLFISFEKFRFHIILID